MRILRLISIAALCAATIGFSASTLAADKLNTPNWDTTLASQTANLVQNRAHLQDLFGHVRDANHAALERKLDEVISGQSLSQPARDAILFRFTVGLADFDEIDTQLIDRLRQVKPRVFVPHEERASFGVPLFNIAGAAEGLYQLQARRSAQSVADSTFTDSPSAWVEAFLMASRSERRGYTDALGSASAAELQGILGRSLEQLASAKDLTPVAGKTALLLGDVGALQQVIKNGGGPELSRILEAAGLTLPPQDTLSLLSFAIEQAPAVNASLAIAQLYTPVESLPEANDLLFRTLGNTELGSAAGLALAKNESEETRHRLRQVAREEDGLAPARARLALDARSAQEGLER